MLHSAIFSQYYTDFCRYIGGACRVRVLRFLQLRFPTPKLAEQYFDPELARELNSIPENTAQPPVSQCDEQSSFPQTLPEDDISSPGSVAVQRIDTLAFYSGQIARMSPEDQLKCACDIFPYICVLKIFLYQKIF